MFFFSRLRTPPSFRPTSATSRYPLPLLMLCAAAVMTGGICIASPSRADEAKAARVELPSEWEEGVFDNKGIVGKFHVAIAGDRPQNAHTVVGERRFYRVRKQDTLLDIARFFDLGQSEILEANPGVDKWVPPVDQEVLLPTQWVLPETELKGIRVNIPEMRLYHFVPTVGGVVMVSTFPVGLGRDEWRTPRGSFKVRDKSVDPTWVLPESIKAERRRDGRPAPNSVAGGSPDNPLGKHRLALTLPSYAIHGTNIPWGVGQQVSHGCVRMYPEDIATLFQRVDVGTPGEFLYQPVKLGARDGRIYLEVHQDIYSLTPGLYRESVRLIENRGWLGFVDLARVERAILEQSGIPFDISPADDSIGEETVVESATPDIVVPEKTVVDSATPRVTDAEAL